MPKIASSKGKKRVIESRLIKCLIVSIKYADFIYLEEPSLDSKLHNAVELTKDSIATEEEAGGMESNNTANPHNAIESTNNSFVNENVNNAANLLKTYGILRDIDLDKNYNETKPFKKNN